jgi:hypothetical protein
MLQVILYIIPVFIVYIVIRRCWVSNETLKTRYKIARLKDELTWLAISGEVSRDNKAYAHLYSSIDKSLVALPSFNFWVMLYLLIKEKSQISLSEIKKVHNEAEKNATLKEINAAYYKLIIAYIARKNCLTVLLSFPLWKKILIRQLTAYENGNTHGQNGNMCAQAKEYSSLAFYIQHISANSILTR